MARRCRHAKEVVHVERSRFETEKNDEGLMQRRDECLEEEKEGKTRKHEFLEGVEASTQQVGAAYLATCHVPFHHSLEESLSSLLFYATPTWRLIQYPFRLLGKTELCMHLFTPLNILASSTSEADKILRLK